jgi:hypothetical protein
VAAQHCFNATVLGLELAPAGLRQPVDFDSEANPTRRRRLLSNDLADHKHRQNHSSVHAGSATYINPFFGHHLNVWGEKTVFNSNKRRLLSINDTFPSLGLWQDGYAALAGNEVNKIKDGDTAQTKKWKRENKMQNFRDVYEKQSFMTKVMTSGSVGLLMLGWDIYCWFACEVRNEYAENLETKARILNAIDEAIVQGTANRLALANMRASVAEDTKAIEKGQARADILSNQTSRIVEVTSEIMQATVLAMRKEEDANENMLAALAQISAETNEALDLIILRTEKTGWINKQQFLLLRQQTLLKAELIDIPARVKRVRQNMLLAQVEKKGTCNTQFELPDRHIMRRKQLTLGAFHRVKQNADGSFSPVGFLCRTHISCEVADLVFAVNTEKAQMSDYTIVRETSECWEFHFRPLNDDLGNPVTVSWPTQLEAEKEASSVLQRIVTMYSPYQSTATQRKTSTWLQNLVNSGWSNDNPVRLPVTQVPLSAAYTFRANLMFLHRGNSCNQPLHPFVVSVDLWDTTGISKCPVDNVPTEQDMNLPVFESQSSSDQAYYEWYTVLLSLQEDSTLNQYTISDYVGLASEASLFTIKVDTGRIAFACYGADVWMLRMFSSGSDVLYDLQDNRRISGNLNGSRSLSLVHASSEIHGYLMGFVRSGWMATEKYTRTLFNSDSDLEIPQIGDTLRYCRNLTFIQGQGEIDYDMDQTPPILKTSSMAFDLNLLAFSSLPATANRSTVLTEEAIWNESLGVTNQSAFIEKARVLNSQLSEYMNQSQTDFQTLGDGMEKNINQSIHFQTLADANLEEALLAGDRARAAVAYAREQVIITERSLEAYCSNVTQNTKSSCSASSHLINFASQLRTCSDFDRNESNRHCETLAECLHRPLFGDQSLSRHFLSRLIIHWWAVVVMISVLLLIFDKSLSLIARLLVLGSRRNRNPHENEEIEYMQYSMENQKNFFLCVNLLMLSSFALDPAFDIAFFQTKVYIYLIAMAVMSVQLLLTHCAQYDSIFRFQQIWYHTSPPAFMTGVFLASNLLFIQNCTVHIVLRLAAAILTLTGAYSTVETFIVITGPNKPSHTDMHNILGTCVALLLLSHVIAFMYIMALRDTSLVAWAQTSQLNVSYSVHVLALTMYLLSFGFYFSEVATEKAAPKPQEARIDEEVSQEESDEEVSQQAEVVAEEKARQQACLCCDKLKSAANTRNFYFLALVISVAVLPSLVVQMNHEFLLTESWAIAVTSIVHIVLIFILGCIGRLSVYLNRVKPNAGLVAVNKTRRRTLLGFLHRFKMWIAFTLLVLLFLPLLPVFQ